jgi:hypothetical protein
MLFSLSQYVIPAEAGIQVFEDFLDPGFRRGDGLKELIYHALSSLG